MVSEDPMRLTFRIRVLCWTAHTGVILRNRSVGRISTRVCLTEPLRFAQEDNKMFVMTTPGTVIAKFAFVAIPFVEA